MKKRGVFWNTHVGQVMVKSVKKKRFSEYVGHQVMVKDADGPSGDCHGKVKCWSCDGHKRVF